MFYEITAESLDGRTDAFVVRCRTTKLGRWMGFQDWTLRAVDMNRHGRPDPLSPSSRSWCFETGRHVDSESFHAIEVAHWKIEGPKHDEAQRLRALRALGDIQ